MPVCEKCKTPFDEWQHFCLECGNYVRAEPPPGQLGPQCGVQVGLEQNFCHEYAAPGIEDKAHLAEHPSGRKWPLRGIILGLLGIGVGTVLYFFFQPLTISTKDLESTGQPREIADNSAVSGKEESSGPKPVVSVQEDLEGVFTQIKEANLTKDILLYMDTLSAVYPQLDKKREEVFKTWERYDFKAMSFTVNKIQEVGNGQAVVEVNWNTSTRNLITKDLRTDDFQYRVWLVKELGHWKIKKIDKL
jgi:hypothetical protein